MKVGYYRIKRMYGLKGLLDGWYVFSRHILGHHIGATKLGATKLGARNLRRYRVSKGFATRKGAIRAAANLKRKSDAIILTMVKKHESQR